MCNRMTRCVSLSILCLALGCSQEKPAAPVVQSSVPRNAPDVPASAAEPVGGETHDNETIGMALKALGIRFHMYAVDSGFLDFESNILNSEGLIKSEAIEALKKYIKPKWSMSINTEKNLVTDGVLEQISNLPFVISLTIGDTDLITNKGIASLTKMNRLNYLALYREFKADRKPTLMTDEGLTQLAKIDALEGLVVSVDAPGVEGSFISSFGNHSKLATLSLSGGADGNENDFASDGVLSSARGITNLAEFDLSYSNVRGSELAFLKECKNLEKVTLPEITDEAFTYLAGLRNLKSVWTQSEKITGIALRSLSQCPALETCWLLDAKLLTDEDINKLTSLKNLTELRLSGAERLTDASLDHIVKFSKLDWLDFGKTQVTDAGIEKLVPLKNLRILDVKNTKVTEDGAARLKKKMPSLEYVHVGDGS